MIIKKRVYLLSFGFFFILINLFVSMTLEILGTARTLMIDNVLNNQPIPYFTIGNLIEILTMVGGMLFIFFRAESKTSVNSNEI